jgi:hypothetical protein
MAHDPGTKFGTMKAFSTVVSAVWLPDPRFDERTRSSGARR